jgi:hypothetical protein
MPKGAPAADCFFGKSIVYLPTVKCDIAGNGRYADDCDRRNDSGHHDQSDGPNDDEDYMGPIPAAGVRNPALTLNAVNHTHLRQESRLSLCITRSSP